MAAEELPENDIYLNLDDKLIMRVNRPTAELLWQAVNHAVELADEPPTPGSTLDMLYSGFAQEAQSRMTITADGERGKRAISSALGDYAASLLVTIEAGLEPADSPAAGVAEAAIGLATDISTAGYRDPGWQAPPDFNTEVIRGLAAMEQHLDKLAAPHKHIPAPSPVPKPEVIVPPYLAPELPDFARIKNPFKPGGLLPIEPKYKWHLNNPTRTQIQNRMPLLNDMPDLESRYLMNEPLNELNSEQPWIAWLNNPMRHNELPLAPLPPSEQKNGPTDIPLNFLRKPNAEDV